MKQLSETALKQIQDKQYDTELRTAGVEVIYKYGVAFCGKEWKLQWDNITSEKNYGTYNDNLLL